MKHPKFLFLPLLFCGIGGVSAQCMNKLQYGYNFLKEKKMNRNKHLALLVGLFFSSFCSATSLDSMKVKAFLVSDALWLSDSYISDFPGAKPVDNLLFRAKHEGYTHLWVNFHPLVPINRAAVNGNPLNYIYYRYALDGNGNHVKYFQEAFAKAAKYGLTIIPNIPAFTGRDLGVWHNLCPAARIIYALKNGSKDTLTPNPPFRPLHLDTLADLNDNVVGCLPFSDSLDALHDFYGVINSEYQAVVSCNPSLPGELPYVSLEGDENYVPTLYFDYPRQTGRSVKVSDLNAGTYRNPVPTSHLNVILPIGQSNRADQYFLRCAIADYLKSNPGKKMTEAVRYAISSIYVFAIRHEVQNIKEAFQAVKNPSGSTKVFFGGTMFDPQSNGANTLVTSIKSDGSTISFASNWDFAANRRDTLNFPMNAPPVSALQRYAFCKGDANDVVCMLKTRDTITVHLSTGDKLFRLTNDLLFDPWQYRTTWHKIPDDPGQETVRTYHWDTTFNYFTNHGFGIAPFTCIDPAPFQTTVPTDTDNTIRAMRKTFNALLHNTKAQGFLAGSWPCWRDVKASDPGYADYRAYGYNLGFINDSFKEQGKTRHFHYPDSAIFITNNEGYKGLLRKIDYYNSPGMQEHLKIDSLNPLKTAPVTEGSKCRCGDNGMAQAWSRFQGQGNWYNHIELDFWHNDKDMYNDQPFEYNVLETAMWFAKGKPGMPPKPGSWRINPATTK